MPGTQGIDILRAQDTRSCVAKAHIRTAFAGMKTRLG